MSWITKILIASMSMAILTKPLFAQESSPQTDLTVPNLAVDEKDLGDPKKYFVFHQPSVSFETAESDLKFCWRHLGTQYMRDATDFIPWQQNQNSEEKEVVLTQYGIVGAVIGAWVIQAEGRRIRQNRMFNCMSPRGYQPYRTSQKIWNELNTDDVSQSIYLQAKIASGPIPPSPQVLP